MENQHQQIKGYRDLSQTEIDLMNASKILAADVGNFITRLEAVPNSILLDDPRLQPPTGPLIDKRWLAIAKTELQKGFMSLTRSIARPESF